MAEPEAHKNGDYFVPTHLLVDLFANSGELELFRNMMKEVRTFRFDRVLLFYLLLTA